MKIEARLVGAVTVVKPDGPLVGADADQLKAKLTELAKDTFGRVVLDISAVPYVDSRGLESLVDVAQELAQSGKALKLCAVNETVRQAIELTGLSPQFEHFQDTHAAVRSFL